MRALVSSVRLLLPSLLVAAACSSGSGDAPPGSSAGGAGGSKLFGQGGSAGAATAKDPGASCENASECSCWKCDCGNGVTGANRGCQGTCATGDSACGLACSLLGTPGTIVASVDPTGAACGDGPGTGGKGGAGGSSSVGGSSPTGGSSPCNATQNSYDPATIDCTKACAFFGAQCDTGNPCASPYCGDIPDCMTACKVTAGAATYTNAEFGCAAEATSCVGWKSCFAAKCN